jgi:adenine-specific DNA-methyltransferase
VLHGKASKASKVSYQDKNDMIYPRLRVARDLLRDDGVIFISIDDNEVENLKKICNEVFGASNYVSTVIWERAFAPKNDAKYFSSSHDYVVVYAKNIGQFEIGMMERTEEANARYKNLDNDPRGVWASDNLTVKTYSADYDYEITTPSGKVISPTDGRCWFTNKKRMQELIDDNRVWFGESGDNMPRLKRFLSDVQQGMVPITLWKYDEVGHNQEGRQEIKKLFEDKGFFDGPKPVRLLRKILRVANTREDSIILDFFSGSATTAHAVMQLNAEDGGCRKFIMVQLPEVCAEGSEAAKAGYKNICEIGKERIRRAGRKIKDEWDKNHLQLTLSDDTMVVEGARRDAQFGRPYGNANDANVTNANANNAFDTGFRVLKLDSSNMKDVYYTPQEYVQQNFNLDGLIDNIKEDRTPEDLLFQVMLDLGILLSAKIETRKVGGATVFFVEGNYLIACFERVTDEIVTEIARATPYYAVFRDSSFASDSTLVNFEQVFKTYSPITIRRVL